MFATHLDLPVLTGLLRTRSLGRCAQFTNEVWESIDSTNVRALQLARQDAPHGVVVAARHQTAGKGRLGRQWVSPPDAGLYLSVLLRPQLPQSSLPLISFAAGVAAVNACRQACGIKPALKWVNDIVFGGRKLGGILAEATSSDSGSALVVGIGINLRSLKYIPDSPPELLSSAVALEEALSGPVDPNELAAELIWQLEQQYDALERGEQESVLLEWKRNSITLGREVKAVTSSGEIIGKVMDLAADGALIVQQSDGNRVILHAGDVSIRSADGTYA